MCSAGTQASVCASLRPLPSLPAPDPSPFPAPSGSALPGRCGCPSRSKLNRDQDTGPLSIGQDRTQVPSPWTCQSWTWNQECGQTPLVAAMRCLWGSPSCGDGGSVPCRVPTQRCELWDLLCPQRACWPRRPAAVAWVWGLVPAAPGLPCFSVFPNEVRQLSGRFCGSLHLVSTSSLDSVSTAAPESLGCGLPGRGQGWSPRPPGEPASVQARKCHRHTAHLGRRLRGQRGVRLSI